MSRYTDLLGQKVGRLTVIEFRPRRIDAKGRRQIIWRCLCDCGKVVDVASSSLTKKKTRSCGCYKIEKVSGKNLKRRVSPEQRITKIMLYRCKTGAAEKKLSCTLTYEQVKSLIFGNCYYCEKLPSNVYKFESHGPVKYSGIDRVDSSIGYEVGNAVTCCWQCNHAKSSLSREDFIGMALRIAKKWGGEAL